MTCKLEWGSLLALCAAVTSLLGAAAVAQQDPRAALDEMSRLRKEAAHREKNHSHYGICLYKAFRIQINLQAG